jgi:hemerythrin-like domain-containing protein
MLWKQMNLRGKDFLFMSAAKRILPESTLAVYQKQPAVGRFHRALRRKDQYALEELIDYAQRYVQAAGVTAAPESLEIMLLSILIEQHKEILRLQAQVEKILHSC